MAALFLLMATAALAAQITGFFIVDEEEANRSAQQAAQDAVNETAVPAAAAITGSAIAPAGSNPLQPVMSFLKRIFLFWRD